MNTSSSEACLKSFFRGLKITQLVAHPGYKRKFGLSLLIMLSLLSIRTSGQTINVMGANNPGNGITQGNLSLGQTKIVLFGFGVNIRGTLTISEFNLDVESPDNHNKYFSSYKLYRSSDDTFSPDDIQLSSTSKFKKDRLSMSSLNEVFGSASQTKYYFLVGDYTGTSGSVPGSIQFGFSTEQKDDAIVSGKKGYQSFNVTGRKFTISEPSISVTCLDSSINVLRPCQISCGKKNVLLFGFGLKVEGMSVINQINISSTNAIGNYFTNGRLYKSADRVLSSDDVLVSKVTINSYTDKILSIPNLSESFNGGPRQYYLLVADYLVNGQIDDQTIKFQFSASQAKPALVQSDPKQKEYNNFDVQGSTFSFIRAANWMGTTNSDWNNTANWSGGYIPGASDVANIGSQSFVNQPRISADVSVGSIVLGTANPVVLSVDTGVTVLANELIQTSADASVANTLTGKGSLQVNSLQINDASPLAMYSAARATKLIADMSKLSVNNLVLRSGFSNYVNNAEIEVVGNLDISGSLQSVNENAANISSVIGASGSAINLLSGNPFSLSTTGANAILSNGLIRYAASGPQSVEPFISYTDLELSGAGVKTIDVSAPGAFYLNGSLSITAPATIAYSSNINSINIRGDFKGNSSLKSGSLPVTIGGSWLNTVQDSITATVEYDGSANQTVGALYYNDVNFRNGGIKTLTGPATVKGLIEIGSNTVVNTGNNLTLYADSLSYASIKPLVDGADIQGKVTIKSFIKGGKRGYLTLSSPVYDTISTVNPAITGFTYVQFKKFMPTTGNGGPANGFDEGAVVNPYGPTVRLYREQSSPTQGQYTFPLKVTDTISTGKGFFFYFRGNRDNIYNKVNPPYITPESVMMEYNGFVNRGDINVPITYTNYSNVGDDGFNLVGNPYPATIDLHVLLAGTPYTKVWIPTLANIYAVYDLTLQSGTNGASRYMMPGQAFYIQAKAPDVLKFTENCKVNSIMAPRVMSAEKSAKNNARAFDYVKLRVAGGKGNVSDEAIIVFTDGGSSSTTAEDAGLISDGNSLIGSMSSDNSTLAINYFPKMNSDQDIKLKVSGEESGSFQLNIAEASMQGFADILIKDNYTNAIRSIKDGSAYSFIIDQKTSATYGAERFVLVFKGKSESTSSSKGLDKGADVKMQVFPNPVSDNLQIRLGNNGQPVEVRIFNMVGELVQKANYSGGVDLITLNVASLRPGTYILKVADSAKNIIYKNTKFIKR